MQDSVLVHRATSDHHSHFRAIGQAQVLKDMAEEASSVARKKQQPQTQLYQNKEKFSSFVAKLYRAAMSKLHSSRHIRSAVQLLRSCKATRRQPQVKVAISVDQTAPFQHKPKRL